MTEKFQVSGRQETPCIRKLFKQKVETSQTFLNKLLRRQHCTIFMLILFEGGLHFKQNTLVDAVILFQPKLILWCFAQHVPVVIHILSCMLLLSASSIFKRSRLLELFQRECYSYCYIWYENLPLREIDIFLMWLDVYCMKYNFLCSFYYLTNNFEISFVLTFPAMYCYI